MYFLLETRARARPTGEGSFDEEFKKPNPYLISCVYMRTAPPLLFIYEHNTRV